ncbi:disulfide bond formation protein B [Albidovulum sp.]|uniref:disulfide bond formation protein B n=1 Tax=Albidovulum sp. TaxID=1872424 RepID=UPI001DDBD03A|nr:disulfide bond formation protein B [Paracoccaceae bacterium]MCC0046424.1 disulfide bond formation protein B [Defluviimonas sp.]MCB2119809.1 disulfide bond formation protein B [Paracoccaceae bacterium]MCB2121577.1 disulfide bond formation protein B [Paracoccaceae bacterium]MCB2134118.1 disulfide bond formation protein B [Paracoccaceae bacterium]
MTRTRFILLAALGSVLLLGGAFVFQAFGYAPCKLCLWQRWPHAAAIVIAGLGLIVGWRVLPWLGAAAAATTGAIGVFHAGVELGWWEGPTTCTSGAIGGLSVDDLLAQINAAPLIRCDEIAWSLLGVSMAGWNAIISFALAAIWVMAATRRA